MSASLTCEVCGDGFERTGTRGPIPFACGPRCRGTAFRRRQGMAARIFLTADERRRRDRERHRAKRGTTPDLYLVHDVDTEATTYLPGAPFAAWAATRASRVGGVGALAKHMGVDEAHLRRIITGKQKTVPLDMVDDALLKTETGLWELYPDLYADAA